MLYNILYVESLNNNAINQKAEKIMDGYYDYRLIGNFGHVIASVVLGPLNNNGI